MKTLSRLFLAAGVVLFAVLLARIGPGVLFRDVRLVGARLAILVALGSAVFAFDTLGWRFAIPRADRRRVSLPGLFAMRIAGDAVNYLTPSAAVGGELVRIALVRRRLEATPAIASVALLVIAQFFSQVIFVAAGIVYCLPRLMASRYAAFAAIPLGFLAALAAGLAFLAFRSDGFRRLDRALARIPGLAKFAGSGSAEALDAAIFGAFRTRPGDVAAAVACFVAGWSVGIVDAWLILRFLRAPVSWGTAFSIEALSVLVETAFFFVPAKAGTQEGGKVAIFEILGLSAEKGFALGLVRRLRELVWAFAGLAALAALSGDARRAGSGPDPGSADGRSGTLPSGGSSLPVPAVPPDRASPTRARPEAP